MKRSPSGYSPNNARDMSQVPRGTPPAQLPRWQMATTLKDRLELIYGNSDVQYVLRLATGSRNYRELIRRYSNDSML